VTEKKAGREPPEHIVAQNRLHLAILIRCFNGGEGGYFILEDVATRRRQRFESVEALLSGLEALLRN
jgi:hypothetical protein